MHKSNLSFIKKLPITGDFNFKGEGVFFPPNSQSVTITKFDGT